LTPVEWQHELPNIPSKSIKGVLVECGPDGYSPGQPHAESAFIYATVLEGAIRSQVNDGPVATYETDRASSRCPAIVTALALMPARRTGRPGCSWLSFAAKDEELAAGYQRLLELGIVCYSEP